MVAEEAFCVVIEGFEYLMRQVFAMNALHVCGFALSSELSDIRMSQRMNIAEDRANFDNVLIAVAHGSERAVPKVGIRVRSCHLDVDAIVTSKDVYRIVNHLLTITDAGVCQSNHAERDLGEELRVAIFVREIGKVIEGTFSIVLSQRKFGEFDTV